MNLKWETDAKIEISEDDERTVVTASQSDQSLEMSGGMQVRDENSDHEINTPRRVDTEMGGRSQASGLEARSQSFDPQRRSTFPRPPRNQTL